MTTIFVTLIGIILSLAILSSEYFVRIEWIYPYFLLVTGFRNEAKEAWLKTAQVDTRIIYKPNPVPEILAEDYSFDAIKVASSNFRYPVVVRGLFKNTTALSKWKDPDYLPEKLGPFQIPIVKDGRVGTLQNDRELVDFGDAFKEMLATKHSKEYIFFPVKSRFTFKGSVEGNDQRLQLAVDRTVSQDLDLDRIWRGFGSSSHTTFVGSQFVIGKSTEEFTNETTGSDWHCAGGNNWFIQAAGKKMWEFIEPKYSPYMIPLKGGVFNMWTGNPDMAIAQKHLPRRSTILEEGDLLYNPDWAWHKVTNFGGLSIGIPIRERNASLVVRNNPIFTAIVASNLVSNILSAKLGFEVGFGGFPAAATRGTEQDN